MRLTGARNLVVLTFGLLLAVSLTISPAQAMARVGNSAGTVAATGMTVADGTVTGASGAAMPGVVVDLYAWPSDAALKAMKPGALVPTTLLAAATTSSAGKYTLQVPAAMLKAAAVESGYANLEIFSAVGGIWFFSYQTSSLPAHPSVPATINLSSAKGVSCGKAPAGETYTFTGFTLQRERKPAWAVVGQGYIVPGKKTAGDAMHFVYAQVGTLTQTSALGVSISGHGFDAGFTVAGTNVSTAQSSQGFPRQIKNTWFRTQFSVGQYRGECVGPQGVKVPRQKQQGTCPRKFTNDLGMVFYVHRCLWLVKSTGWFAGSSEVHRKAIPHAPGKFCAIEQAGGTFQTSKEKAIQWSNGFELGAALGIKGVDLKTDFNSSTQTGYDANAQIIFTFKHDGFACGTNHDAPRAAQVVVRRKR